MRTIASRELPIEELPIPALALITTPEFLAEHLQHRVHLVARLVGHATNLESVRARRRVELPCDLFSHLHKVAITSSAGRDDPPRRRLLSIATVINVGSLIVLLNVAWR